MAAVVAAAFVFGGERHRRKAPVAVPVNTLIPLPAPTSVAPSILSSTAQPAVSELPFSTLPDSTADEPVVPTSATSTTSASTNSTLSVGPIYANGAGLGLFLFEGFGQQDGSIRIDLATGAIEQLSTGPNYGQPVGIAGSDKDARIVDASDLGGDQATPCSDGTWWVGKSDSKGDITSLHRVRPRSGTNPDVVESLDVSGLRGLYWQPSTSVDDRPIFAAPDGGLYAFDVPGTLRRIAKGQVHSIDHGSFAQAVCDDEARCNLVLHGAQNTTVTLPGVPSPFVSFSPDGLHALVMRTAGTGPTSFDSGMIVPTLLGLQLVDMQTGNAVALDTTVAASADSLYGYAGGWARWTPDGAVAVYSDGHRLVRVEIGAVAVSTLDVPGIGAGSGLLIVGIA